MTRAVVFLTAALAAASLGLFAENSSTNPATPTSASAQVQTQGTGNSASQTNAPSSSNPATAASSNVSAQTAPTNRGSAATPNNNRAIQTTEGSKPNNESADTANAQLPQTSTILPLLGLIGLGSLVAGLFARR
jgi:hypothetical protein